MDFGLPILLEQGLELEESILVVESQQFWVERSVNLQVQVNSS